MAQTRLQSASFQTILAQELEVEMEFGEIKLLMSIVAIFKIWKWLVERQRQLSSLIFSKVGKTGYWSAEPQGSTMQIYPMKTGIAMVFVPKAFMIPIF